MRGDFPDGGAQPGVRIRIIMDSIEKNDIQAYPGLTEVTLALRRTLHPLFKGLASEISEFTFANIFLFRSVHNYRVARLEDGNIVITGRDGDAPFFMLPFGLPEKPALQSLLKEHGSMKCVPEALAKEFSRQGYRVVEDRDNFDYLYSRRELAGLSGRRYHRKKNLVNYFTGTYSCEVRPLLKELVHDGLHVLEEWRKGSGVDGDYGSAVEALEDLEELGLCGWIYYVDKEPAAYTLGEELNGNTFVLHFEKGLDRYKGLLQFVNRNFASALPERYELINREQDLGDSGLRQSKLSYRPHGLVKKFRVFPGGPFL